MNAHRAPAAPSLRTIDFPGIARHYLNLCWRFKWWILLSGPLVAAGWVAFVIRAGTPREELAATAVIGVENVGRPVSGGPNAGASRDRIDIMQSTSMLRQVVDSLSLCMSVDNANRDDIFESAMLDSTARRGGYSFEIDTKDKTKFRIRYWNDAQGINGEVIQSASLSTLSALDIPGVAARFNRQFLEAPHDFTFQILWPRTAIESLRSRLSFEDRTNRNTGAGIIRVSLRGTDYPLTAQTVNALVSRFVQGNLTLRQSGSDEYMAALQSELDAARGSVAGSQAALRRFYQTNPALDLAQAIPQSGGGLAGLATERRSAETALRESESQKQKLLRASQPERLSSIREAVAFLRANNVVVALVLGDELENLSATLNEVQDYAASHPRKADALARLTALGKRVFDALDELSGDLRERMAQSDEAASEMRGRLQSIPERELQLGELQRRYDASAHQLSTIQERFNQARLGQSMGSSDIFIMDTALPPIPYSDSFALFTRLALGLFLGFCVSFGPVVLLDQMDRSARSRAQFERLCDLPLLECIPVVEPLVDVSGSTPRRKLRSSAQPPSRFLVTHEGVPGHVAEVFRSLRTKLLLDLHDCPRKSVAISSLNMGEGKSTVSANLAVGLAVRGMKTVLVDADLRRGLVHEIFGLDRKPGLTEFLLEHETVTPEAVAAALRPSGVNGCSVLTSGTYPPNPQELLCGPKFSAIVDALHQLADIVIFDTPPLGLAADAVAMEHLVSRYLFVALSGKTNITELCGLADEYAVLRDKLTGAVLNQATLEPRLKYYRYAKYY